VVKPLVRTPQVAAIRCQRLAPIAVGVRNRKFDPRLGNRNDGSNRHDVNRGPSTLKLTIERAMV